MRLWMEFDSREKKKRGRFIALLLTTGTWIRLFPPQCLILTSKENSNPTINYKFYWENIC